MIHTSDIAARLCTIESLAFIPRVSSTNAIARRIVNECIDHGLSLPQAMIIAGEQFAGRGRNDRRWSSPAGKGIYATLLLTCEVQQLRLLPLAIASQIAGYLREVYGVAAGIKWPNDILVEGNKIAGILIEARVHDAVAYVVIGIGINIEPAIAEERPRATTLKQVVRGGFHGIAQATVAFIEYMDRQMSHPRDAQQIVSDWRQRSVHRSGDRIECVLPTRTIRGIWRGIDDDGRAQVEHDGELTLVSAGDIVLLPDGEADAGDSGDA